MLSLFKKKKATSFSSGKGVWGGLSAQTHTELEYEDLEKREGEDAIGIRARKARKTPLKNETAPH